MARRVPSAAERLTHFARFERHAGGERIQNARLANAGVACDGGEPPDELGAKRLDAFARLRTDADGAKACAFIVFPQRVRGV